MAASRARHPRQRLPDRLSRRCPSARHVGFGRRGHDGARHRGSAPPLKRRVSGVGFGPSASPRRFLHRILGCDGRAKRVNQERDASSPASTIRRRREGWRDAPSGAGRTGATGMERRQLDLEGERSPWKERAHQCWQRRWDATDSSVEEGLEVGPSARSALTALAGNGLRGRCDTRVRASRAVPPRSARRWRCCAENDSNRLGGGIVVDVVEFHLGGSELRPEALCGPLREPLRW